MTDIVIVGSCNVDHITYSPKLPKPGETLEGYKYEKGLGGKGANQCVAARKLGANTAMVGKVGCDTDGDNFVNQFNSLGVNTEFLTRNKDNATGIATIIVDLSGNNSIVIVPGANLFLNSEDVAAASNVIKQSKIVLCQNEISLGTTLEALKTAKSFGKFTVFNPAPAPLQDLDKEFYQLSDIICCNETETLALTGITVEDRETAGTAARILVEKGAHTAIVTLGEDGCVYYEKDNAEPIHVEAMEANDVDSTGAGDCFLGALAFYIASLPFLPLKEKINRSCKIAAVSVGKKGTQSSFPSRNELRSSFFS